MITALQALVTKTAVFNGAAVDVSAITNDVVVKVRVAKLTADKTLRIAIEDSEDNFVADTKTVHVFHFKGAVDPVADVVRSISKRDIPNARIGTANDKWRVSVTAIDAASSVDYEAWIES